MEFEILKSGKLIIRPDLYFLQDTTFGKIVVDGGSAIENQIFVFQLRKIKVTLYTYKFRFFELKILKN